MPRPAATAGSRWPSPATTSTAKSPPGPTPWDGVRNVKQTRPQRRRQGSQGPLAGLLRGGTTLGVLHYLLVVGAERGERDGVLFLLVLTLHVLHRLAYP